MTPRERLADLRRSIALETSMSEELRREIHLALLLADAAVAEVEYHDSPYRGLGGGWPGQVSDAPTPHRLISVVSVYGRASK
jgi:hypothetical protein